MCAQFPAPWLARVWIRSLPIGEQQAAQGALGESIFGFAQAWRQVNGLEP